MQMILGCFGRANQDVWPALILPWIIVVASVGARLSDLGRVWRVSAIVLMIGIGLVTLTGFWPSTAKTAWSHYAPNPGLEASHLAAEAARWRREAGAAFFIATTPEQASLLSFYLPLQPMIYLPAGEGIRHQFDLWNSYYDFQGANALYLTPTTTDLPPQLVREFEEVKKLEEPQAMGQDWLFYSCQRFGASR